jgi:hypothetical protein
MGTTSEKQIFIIFLILKSFSFFTDKLFMMNLDQNEFFGFSFLNPEFVQHV